MKELQNFVYKHMDSLKHHKRYLAMLTALSMLVTFIVPLILIEPADSMTKQRLMLLADDGTMSYPTSFHENISGKDDNMVPNAAGVDGNQVGDVTYSPAQMDILTLLFGAANDGSGNLTHQALYAGCETIEEALEVDKETYFLGYASDFCAFIEGDFTATEADAEGRVAVGGDLSFTPKGNSIWNYQVGSGDYATMKPLQSISGYEEYNNMYGFASALVGGKMFRINTLSTGYGHTRTSKDSLSQEEIRADIDAGYHAVNKDNKYSYSVYYKPEDGLYKYFIVDNAEGSAHYFKDTGEDIPYNKNYPDVECTHDYKADCEICATNSETHSYLGNINELAQMYSMPDGYTVGGLIRDTFEYVRSRSEVLTRIDSINVTPNGENIIFDATGKVKPDAKTVYFTVDNWTGDYGYIEFKGIPENASVIVNCNNSGVVYAVGGQNNAKKDVTTVFNGKPISNKDGPGNNSPESSRILYNFPNATELHINGNFNGTILAPNADVKSKENECTGHLSGALIAKSFYGGLEFGYRPYRAGNDILGMTSGYEVPVDKLIANTETLLPGALFEIAEILLDENGNEILDNGKRAEQVLSIFESGNSTKYVALPSYVDFSGNTLYMGETIEGEGAYREVNSNGNTGTRLDAIKLELSSPKNGQFYVEGENVEFQLTNAPSSMNLQYFVNGNYCSSPSYTFNNSGDYTITVTVQGSDNYSYSKVITVVKKPYITVTNENPVVGDEIGLSVANLPNDVTVQWSVNNGGNIDENAVFKPSQAGNYTITATLSNDVTITKDITVKSNIDSNNLRIKVISPENRQEYYINEEIIFGIENAPDDAEINYSIYFYSNGDYSIMDANQYSIEDKRVKISFLQACSHKIEATVNGVALQPLYVDIKNPGETGGGNETDSPEGGGTGGTENDGTPQLTVSAPQNGQYYVVGETITIEIESYSNLWVHHEQQQYYSQNTKSFEVNRPGKYKIIAVVFDSSGNQINYEKEIEVIDSNSGTYSVRRNINYLADENTNDSNKITVTANSGEYIESVKLNVNQTDNDYQIKVTRYSENNADGTSEIKNKNNNTPIVIDFTEKDITRVVIEAEMGAVNVDSYDVKYLVPCKRVTKTYPADVTISSNNSYTIELEELVKPLDSFTLNFGSETGYFKFELLDSNGNIIGYQYNNNQNHEWSYSNSKFEFNNSMITFQDNKTINDVAKIRVEAKSGSESVSLKTYSITTLKASDYIVPENQSKTFVKEHKYIIREAKAPQGYFKTDDYYEVTITETLNTENVDNDTIPMLVDTVIDVKFVDVTTDDAGNITSTNTGNYYNSNFTIKYGRNENNEPDLNTRIIEIGDETFTIEKNNDGGKIKSVTSNDTELQLSDEKLLKDCKATEFTHNGKKYYYNPETMMIIPLPSENEKNLEFSNESGLLFKKVDERGVLVDGATITVTKENVEVTSFTDSSKLFNLSDFDAGVEYTFTETATPNGYETAKPVHFMLNEDKTEVKWWSEGEDEPETYTPISEAVIEMVDDRILGAKLKLKKIDADTKDNLSGAIFELYASDDTLIKAGIDAYNGLDGTGVDIDLTTVEEAGSKFVENGYLKPGSYYLLETTRPVDSSNYPYKDPGKICFTVGNAANNYGITYVPNTSGGSGSGGSTGDGTLSKDEADANWGDGTYDYWLLDLNGKSMKETSSGGKIENVKRIQVVLTPWNGNAIQLKQCWTNLGQTCDTGITDKFTGENTVSRELDWTLDSATDLTQFKIVGSSIIVAYIKITTSDGTEYVFQDASYNPVSTASLEDEISAAANGDEPAVIDEADADTKAPILDPVRGEGDNKTTLVIGNEVDDGKVDITVKKVWPNDGFDSARPSVTIELWRTTTEISETERNYPSTINGEQVLDSDGNPVEVTLSGDTWSHTFTDLDSRYAAGDDGFGQYYYYIIEDTVVGYTAASYTIVGNELTVTNELDSVEVKVEKIWNTENADIIPDSVTLQLQIRIDSDVNGPIQPENYTWENVEGKTITLVKSVFNGSKTWSGDEFKITGLLKGKTYRLTETDVPGWRITEDSQKILTIDSNGNTTDGKLSITNEPKPPETGSLTISKYWDTDEGKPGEVYVKLYRKAVEKYWPEQSAAEVQEDYARLLQYSLYFYDANMCGETAEEHSALSWRNNCHTDDQVKGGYHDAGDHVMFGLPQGYSASMLGWSYYEFKDAYEALGQTEHLKLITEHFCDFFVQAIRNNNGTTEILVQKGAGNPDHQFWGAPELQVGEYSRMDEVELEGDAATGWPDGKKTLENEMFWRSTGGDIAAEYAAALALAYLNFYDENAPKAEKDKYNGYLAKAIEFYNFAQGKDALNEWGVNKDETATGKKYPGFYSSDSAVDDRAWAAGWLYLATNTQAYKDACSNATPGWAFSWNDVKLAAACVYAHVNGDTSDAWSEVRSFLTGANGINSNLKSDGYFCRDAWGSARYNAALQMVALVAAKYNSSEAQTYKNFAQTQMAKILGANDWNNGDSVCLVTGFADNSAQYAHHRAASGWDKHTEYKVNPDYDKDGHMLIGAMVGGPSFGEHDEDQMRTNGHTNLTTSVHGTYVDDLHDYCCNEVALDYQAGLVGAAAGLYYFFESGHTYEIPGVEKQYLQSEPEILIPPEYYVNNEVVMTVGTEVYLAALEFADSDVTWSVTDDYGNSTGSATISDSGIFKALNAGKVTVKAESGAQVVTVKINIVNAENAQVAKFSNVSLNQKNAISKLADESHIKSSVSFGTPIDVNLENIVRVIIRFDWNGEGGFQWKGSIGNAYYGSGACNSYEIDLNSNPISLDTYTVELESAWSGAVVTLGSVEFITREPEIPLIITPEKYYLERNQEFSVSAPESTGKISWDFSHAAGFSETDSGKLKASGTAGTYTITGTDEANKVCAFSVVVLSPGTKAYEMPFSNLSGTWNQTVDVPGDIRSQVREVALVFDKKGTTNDPKFGIQFSGEDKPTEYKFSEISDYLIRTRENTNGNLSNVQIVTHYNPDNVMLKKAYIIYNTGDTFDITPEKASLVLGEKTKLNLSNHTGEITWNPNDYVTITKESDGNYYATLKYNASGSTSTSITISGTDTDEKSGSATINVKPLSVNATGAVVGEKITVKTDNEPIDCNIEYSYEVVNNSQGSVTINGADITANTAGTVKIIAIAKHNGEEVSRATSSEITISPWTINGLTPMEVDDVKTFESNRTGTFKWSSSKPDVATIDPDTGKVTAISNGSTTITVTDGTYTSEPFTLNVNNKSFSFTINGEKLDTNETYEIHEGESIALIPNLDVANYDYNSEYIDINRDNMPHTITAKAQTPNEISVTATATDGQTVTFKIYVVGSFSIVDPNGESYETNESSRMMYNGERLQLRAINSVGNVHWAITPQGNEQIAIVDTDTGLVTAIKSGNVVVTATDENGTTATYNITIKLKAVDPGFDYSNSSFEYVGKYKISGNNGWKLTIDNLDLTDENGNYYMYYIVECDGSGNPISSNGTIQSIQGSGATFVPTEYENGVMLAQVKTNAASVKNSLSGRVQGQLPSTGGSGVKTYYYFGGALMLLGIAGFTGLKRRERKRRKE